MPVCAGMIFFILASKSEICNRKAAQIAAKKKRDAERPVLQNAHIFFYPAVKVSRLH